MKKLTHSSGEKSRLKATVRHLAVRLDKAITMGVASAYPMVFNLPTPDPVPDWKRIVRIGWKMTKYTLVEAYKILRQEEREP